MSAINKMIWKKQDEECSLCQKYAGVKFIVWNLGFDGPWLENVKTPCEAQVVQVCKPNNCEDSLTGGNIL